MLQQEALLAREAVSDSLQRTSLYLKQSLHPRQLAGRRALWVAVGVAAAGGIGLLTLRRSAPRDAIVVDATRVTRRGRTAQAVGAVLDGTMRTAWSFLASALLGSLFASPAVDAPLAASASVGGQDHPS